jgi:hypothetical protein
MLLLTYARMLEFCVDDSFCGTAEAQQEARMAEWGWDAYPGMGMHIATRYGSYLTNLTAH